MLLINRRSGRCILSLLFFSVAIDAAAKQFPWTLAVIGDQQIAVTHHEKRDLLDRFTSQTQWLARHGASLNLRFVAQVGDIVEHSIAIAEWDRPLAAMQ